jgi:hypothetical protein
MAHYFADTSFEGALEVTKLMIPLSTGNPEAKKRSFPAQELPIAGNGTWIPRVLHEPQEISDYVWFLRGDVQRQRTSHPSKAVKRAFSLSRILFLDEFTDEFLKFVRGSDILLESSLRSRAEYAEKVRKFDDGQFTPTLFQRVLSAAVGLAKRASRREVSSFAELTSDEILAAIRALPEGGGASVEALLDSFLHAVDVNIETAVH